MRRGAIRELQAVGIKHDAQEIYVTRPDLSLGLNKCASAACNTVQQKIIHSKSKETQTKL
jgi:hypothetical protein